MEILNKKLKKEIEEEKLKVKQIYEKFKDVVFGCDEIVWINNKSFPCGYKLKFCEHCQKRWEDFEKIKEKYKIICKAKNVEVKLG